MRLAEHMARMGDIRDAYRISVERSDGKRPLRRARHDGSCDGEAWTGLNWLGTGTDGGYL